jgi:hypothetical protein
LRAEGAGGHRGDFTLPRWAMCVQRKRHRGRQMLYAGPRGAFSRCCVPAPPLPADFMKEVAAFAGLVYSYWKMFRHHSMRVVFGRALVSRDTSRPSG